MQVRLIQGEPGLSLPSLHRRQSRATSPHPGKTEARRGPRPSIRLFVAFAFLGLALLVAPRHVLAATRSWTGLGATSNWSLAANWSGAVVPVAADTVVFDITSVKDATIDVNVSVASVTVAVGYTGTITLELDVREWASKPAQLASVLREQREKLKVVKQ